MCVHDDNSQSLLQIQNLFPLLITVVLNLFASTLGPATTSGGTSSDDATTGACSVSGGEDRGESSMADAGERGGLAAEREGEEERAEGRVGTEGRVGAEGREGSSAGSSEAKPLLNGAGGFARPKHPLAKFVISNVKEQCIHVYELASHTHTHTHTHTQMDKWTNGQM